MLRAKSRSINNTTFINNRLVRFAKNPSKTLDVIVERNETVEQNLSVGGDLTVGNDLHAKNFYANGGNFFLNSYLLIPYGTIIQSASVLLPEGWMNCDGAIILKTTYTNLFNAIGYTYSTDFSGSDLSFNVPDLKGRVAVGAGTGAGLTSRTLGRKGGEESHILTTGEIPAHSHSLTRRSNPDSGAFDTGGGHAQESSAATTDRATDGTFSTTSVGSGQSHNNMQPFIVLRYIIKY